MSGAAADKTNDNPNNITFTIRDTKLCVSVVTIKNYQNFLAKDVKDQCDWNEYKAKSIKTQQMSIDIFSNQNLQELIDFDFFIY